MKELTKKILAILPLSEVIIDFEFFKKGSGKEPYVWEQDTVIVYFTTYTELPKWFNEKVLKEIEIHTTDKELCGLAIAVTNQEDGEVACKNEKIFEQVAYDKLIERNESQIELRNKIEKSIKTFDFLPEKEINLYILECIKSIYN